MPAYTTVTLDTLGPQGVVGVINNDDAYTAVRDVTFGITMTDPDPTGYQMKVWGTVDLAANAAIQDTEVASDWISFSAAQAVRLATGDGVKTLNVRVRDDVQNESTVATDSITLDTSAPVPTINVEATPARISKIAGKNVTTLEWSASDVFEAYEVRVVPSTGSTRAAGAVIATTNGSANTSGVAGAYPAATNIVTTINAADLEIASAGDGAKIIKVFVQDDVGNWSV